MPSKLLPITSSKEIICASHRAMNIELIAITTKDNTFIASNDLLSSFNLILTFLSIGLQFRFISTKDYIIPFI